MKVAKIVLTFVLVGSFIYSCTTTTEQESSVSDSTSVTCDTVCVDSSACHVDSACVDSTK